jgi:DNA-nicking Smr family endonuclease
MPRHPHFDPHDPLLDAPVAATLDLHGFSATEAAAAVRTFLDTWRRRQPGAVVHLITGKGKRSTHGPVLRGLVKGLLKGELAAGVAEWGSDDSEGGYKVRLR